MGDPLETAALAASGWTYAADTALSPDRKACAALLTRYHFNSTIKRMAVTVRRLLRCSVEGGVLVQCAVCMLMCVCGAR